MHVGRYIRLRRPRHICELTGCDLQPPAVGGDDAPATPPAVGNVRDGDRLPRGAAEATEPPQSVRARATSICHI